MRSGPAAENGAAAVGIEEAVECPTRDEQLAVDSAVPGRGRRAEPCARSCLRRLQDPGGLRSGVGRGLRLADAPHNPRRIHRSVDFLASVASIPRTSRYALPSSIAPLLRRRAGGRGEMIEHDDLRQWRSSWRDEADVGAAPSARVLQPCAPRRRPAPGGSRQRSCRACVPRQGDVPHPGSPVGVDARLGPHRALARGLRGSRRGGRFLSETSLGYSATRRSCHAFASGCSSSRRAMPRTILPNSLCERVQMRMQPW